MKANPDKFQFIVFGRSINQRRKITIHGTHIDSQDTVKLLGVKLDQHLIFDEHIKDICLKAGRKLSVLSRMSNVLDKDAKLQLTNAFTCHNSNIVPAYGISAVGQIAGR